MELSEQPEQIRRSAREQVTRDRRLLHLDVGQENTSSVRAGGMSSRSLQCSGGYC